MPAPKPPSASQRRLRQSAQQSTGSADSFQGVVGVIHKHARRPYTEVEAAEAARNLIGFCQLALDIRRRQIQDGSHGKRR